jgi:hypothetical protein
MKKDKREYINSLQSYLEECHFDTGMISPNPFKVDEAHLAKMLTRIVVSTATAITTTISLRQYLKEIYFHYRKDKNVKLP